VYIKKREKKDSRFFKFKTFNFFNRQIWLICPMEDDYLHLSNIKKVKLKSPVLSLSLSLSLGRQQNRHPIQLPVLCWFFVGFIPCPMNSLHEIYYSSCFLRQPKKNCLFRLGANISYCPCFHKNLLFSNVCLLQQANNNFLCIWRGILLPSGTFPS